MKTGIIAAICLICLMPPLQASAQTIAGLSALLPPTPQNAKLSLARQTPDLTVYEWSDYGGTNATALAKMTREDVESSCENWLPGDADCTAGWLADKDGHTIEDAHRWLGSRLTGRFASPTQLSGEPARLFAAPLSLVAFWTSRMMCLTVRSSSAVRIGAAEPSRNEPPTSLSIMS